MASRLARALVMLAAIGLTIHLAQHVADGIASPKWFFALGVVGALGLWATAALWARGTPQARAAVLVVLGAGLIVGGLGMHAAEAAADGLTATHATGIVAGALGVAILATVPANLKGSDPFR